MRVGTCVTCGSEFAAGTRGRIKAHCPAHKPPTVRKTTERTCGTCLMPFQASKPSRKYCSFRCAGLGTINQRRAKLVEGQRKANEARASERLIGTSCALNWRMCGRCGVEWLAKGRSRHYPKPVCQECQKARERAYYRAHAESISRAQGFKQHRRTCLSCGAEFIGHGQATSCSLECRKARQRAQRRKEKSLRRKGMRVVERFSPDEIFRRDAFRCQLCLKALAMGATVPHPLAPTIDHIVPVSRGGEHSRANVQAAHFICNSLRSNLGAAQLRLA